MQDIDIAIPATLNNVNHRIEHHGDEIRHGLDLTLRAVFDAEILELLFDAPGIVDAKLLKDALWDARGKPLNSYHEINFKTELREVEVRVTDASLFSKQRPNEGVVFFADRAKLAKFKATLGPGYTVELQFKVQSECQPKDIATCCEYCETEVQLVVKRDAKEVAERLTAQKAKWPVRWHQSDLGFEDEDDDGATEVNF